MLYDKNQRNKVIVHDGVSSADKVIRTGVILFILLIKKNKEIVLRLTYYKRKQTYSEIKGFI